mgnify:CR=1 FL=1
MALGADYERLLSILKRAGVPVVLGQDATFIQIPGTRFDFDRYGKLLGCVVVLP